MLKEKVEALFKAGAQQTFELKQSSSALKKFATQYVIEGREGYDLQTFLSDVKREVTTLLENNRKTKGQVNSQVYHGEDEYSRWTKD